MPVPVSAPKSPLVMNGQVTVNIPSPAQLTTGALAGPQAPSNSKVNATTSSTHSFPFKVMYTVCQFDTETNNKS